ncbi:MAG: alginate lyase family protein [Anaerolineales bacterium]
MSKVKNFGILLRSLNELGLNQVGHYILYEVALRSGYMEWSSQKILKKISKQNVPQPICDVFPLPKKHSLKKVLGEQIVTLFEEAQGICQGKTLLFGHEWAEINYCSSQPKKWFSRLALWERQESRKDTAGLPDLKYEWELARFNWVYPLGRAYRLSPQEEYAEVFWHYFEEFIEHNPPYFGIHWLSGQEIALRLIAWIYGYTIFADSPSSTTARKKRLVKSVVEHASRIPITIDYSLAQNNNHLLSDAAGLVTAAIFLPDYPLSSSWLKHGWRWFNWGIQHQIQEDGAYLQHSCNYQRLMLQLALWVNLILLKRKESFPLATLEKLKKATIWLGSVLEINNGKVPNFGPNDGAYIQPLNCNPFEDYRPVLQAAQRAFLGKPLFPPGTYDEMSLWYGMGLESQKSEDSSPKIEFETITQRRNSMVVIRPKRFPAWADLRCTRFNNRPGHADQLHVDLWWNGVNIMKDAGTYLYTAPPPWDNALAETFYHNTITINDRNQMEKAGRFLWLDWAQGKVVSQENDAENDIYEVTAEHDGYQKWGIIHRRKLRFNGDGTWTIHDQVIPKLVRRHPHPPTFRIRLHWLLEDCPWKVLRKKEDWLIQFETLVGMFQIQISSTTQNTGDLYLVRKGETIYGEGDFPTPYGWYSPSYRKKEPAISLILDVQAALPQEIQTDILLSNTK